MKKTALIGILLFWLVSCQAMTTLNMSPLAEQKRFYSDGAVVVSSPKKQSIALVAASSMEVPNGQRLKLVLNVLNIGNQSFDIDTSNIRVSSPQTDPIKIYSYDELVREEEQQRNTALVLTAISGAADAYSASQAGTVYTSGNYQSTTASPYGRYRTTGTYSGTFYDPARAQLASNLAAARTENQINNISENSQARLNNLQDTILKRTTVFPGMDHGGMFSFDAPRLNEGEERVYDISIDLAGETHKFQLLQSLQGPSKKNRGQM